MIIVYLVFTHIKISLFRCHFTIVKKLQQQIFILYENLSEIITTQIGPYTENSETFTQQIISSIIIK